MSSDSDSSASYYSVFLGSGDKTSQRIYSPQTINIYYPWNELYYCYFMLCTFAYCLIINVSIVLCLSYSSFEHNLNDDVKLKALIWSIIQMFLTIIYQPNFFSRVIFQFENFQSYVNIFFVLHLSMFITNILFLAYSVDLINLFVIWASLNLLAFVGHVANKCCQNRIQKYYGY